MAAKEGEEEGFEPMDMDTVAHQRGQLKMAVCGKVQTGRSALINTLLGRGDIEEHLSPEGQPQGCIGYGTQVEVRESNKRRTRTIDVLLWDTPGLGGAVGDTVTEDSLRQVTEKVKETDVLIYCIDMRVGLEQDDVDGIVQLTEALGEEIWRNAVFVLSYANTIVPPPDSTAEKVPYFQRSLSEWESTIKTTLRNKASVSEEIITDTAIVPIGYRKQPPPDRKDWLTPFWREVFRKMKENSLLEGMDVYNLSIGPAGVNWLHVGVGVAAGTALGAVTGGVGLGIVGALVGAGIGGVGSGSVVALVERLPVGKLVQRMRD